MFRCEQCNYQTTLSFNYTRHLNSTRHIKNISKDKNVDGINTSFSQMNKKKMNQNEPKMNQNEPKMNQNEPKMNQQEKLNNSIQNNVFQCSYCSETFYTKPSMRRHEIHRCKFNINFKDKFNKSEKDKKKLYKYIESMLVENGKTINNTIMNTNNINSNNRTINNIVLNNYGNEDLTHITDQVLENLIKGPRTMITELTKMIHFNKNKPQNMNVYIPNKRDKHVKTYIGCEWILEDKKYRILDILDKSYNMLDSHYENNESKFSNFNKKNYKIIQLGIDNNNKKIIKGQYDNLELEILNNSNKNKDMIQNHLNDNLLLE